MRTTSRMHCARLLACSAAPQVALASCAAASDQHRPRSKVACMHAAAGAERQQEAPLPVTHRSQRRPLRRVPHEQAVDELAEAEGKVLCGDGREVAAHDLVDQGQQAVRRKGVPVSASPCVGGEGGVEVGWVGWGWALFSWEDRGVLLAFREARGVCVCVCGVGGGAARTGSGGGRLCHGCPGWCTLEHAWGESERGVVTQGTGSPGAVPPVLAVRPERQATHRHPSASLERAELVEHAAQRPASRHVGQKVRSELNASFLDGATPGMHAGLALLPPPVHTRRWAQAPRRPHQISDL